VLLGVASALPAGDWPNFRGPNHDGISRETGWATDWTATPPKPVWKAKVGLGYAAVIVADGRAFTTGNTRDVDTVFCFDAQTGKVIWKHSYAAPVDAKYYEGGTSASPTVAGDRVYTLSKRGVVHCLAAADGKVIWTKDLAAELDAKIPTWGFAGSILIEGDRAILNVGSAGTALDKNTGKVLWKSGPVEAGYSTPVPYDAAAGRAVMLATQVDFVAVLVADGRELWRIPWKTQYEVNAADPILVGSKVFVSSGYNRGGGVFDVSSQPPKPIWSSKDMRNQLASSVHWQGHLYGVDENQLRCLEFETGKVKWTDKVSGKGTVMMAGGKLVVLSERGELLLAEPSPEGFKPSARAQVIGGKCWSAPTLAHGKFYVRTGSGDVACVDVSGK
jgi:outer membrane protein assembly factor BamB